MYRCVLFVVAVSVCCVHYGSDCLVSSLFRVRKYLVSTSRNVSVTEIWIMCANASNYFLRVMEFVCSARLS